MASANGAWRALIEWCDEFDRECGQEESADYITAVLGPEPRAIDEGCAWRQYEDVIVDAYENTWSILGETRQTTAKQLLARYPADGCDGA
jgi:hypothetical protein